MKYKQQYYIARHCRFTSFETASLLNPFRPSPST
jgi:hypothetical protein